MIIITSITLMFLIESIDCDSMSDNFSITVSHWDKLTF